MTTFGRDRRLVNTILYLALTLAKGVKLPAHDFVIRKKFMRDGSWIREDEELGHIAPTAAIEKFKERAYEMDKEFGDSHFWTCTLRTEGGDYFEVFHDRVVSGYMDY